MNPFKSLISGLLAAFTNPNVLSLLGFTLFHILCASAFGRQAGYRLVSPSRLTA